MCIYSTTDVNVRPKILIVMFWSDPEFGTISKYKSKNQYLKSSNVFTWKQLTFLSVTFYLNFLLCTFAVPFVLPNLSNCCDGNVRFLLTNHASACQGRDLTQRASTYSTCRWWRKLRMVTELIAAPRSGTAASTNRKMLEFQAMWPNLTRKCPGVLNTSNGEVGFMSLRKGKETSTP